MSNMLTVKLSTIGDKLMDLTLLINVFYDTVDYFKVNEISLGPLALFSFLK